MKQKCDLNCEDCKFDDCISTSTISPYVKEKQKYSQKEYYKRNRNKILGNAKEYYQKHREERKKKSLEYYYAHKEEIALKRKERRCK